jgi:DNA polymerase-3 subunit delta
VLLHGAEGLLTETYTKRLAEQFVKPAAGMLDFMRFDGEETEADAIIASCDTLPMMSEKRVVLVSNFPADERTHTSAKAKALADYLPLLPASTLLIFTAAAFPKRSALYKSLTANGKVYEFGRLDKDDLHAFIRGRFKAAGKVASNEVADAVARTSGYFERDSAIDLFSIAGDIKRVAAYAAPNEDRAVGLVDVAACMGTLDETHVFALLDSICSGRKGEALELLENITSKGEAAYRLLALLTGQFEIMLGYREMRERAYSFPEMCKALGIRSDYRLKKAAGFADKYSVSTLMKLLDRLYRVDRDIKTGLYGERLALTMFIAEM